MEISTALLFPFSLCNSDKTGRGQTLNHLNLAHSCSVETSEDAENVARAQVCCTGRNSLHAFKTITWMRLQKVRKMIRTIVERNKVVPPFF